VVVVLVELRVGDLESSGAGKYRAYVIHTVSSVSSNSTYGRLFHRAAINIISKANLKKV
jgi:hypothetical protein